MGTAAKAEIIREARMIGASFMLRVQIVEIGVLRPFALASAGPPLSELSHQRCPFQEGYLRLFSVTFLQITCKCFPARFLVTIIFQQLSFQLMTGQNTSCPTTLRAGRENVLWSGKGDTNGLVLQQQRIDHAIGGKPLLCLDHKIFRSIEICYSYQCYSVPGTE